MWGANVIDKIRCENRYGSDNHKYLIALLKQTQKDISIFPSTINKETYDDVRQNYKENKYEDWFIGLVGFCASYNAKWFGGYANNVKTKEGVIRNYADEAIRNLIKQSKDLKDIKFECLDFKEIKPIKNFLIYCDIPYRNSTTYSSNDFPYGELYEWCRKMSKDNIVLISEYTMPDDFECIWKKDIKCTLNNKQVTNKTEKLFIYRGN